MPGFANAMSVAVSRRNLVRVPRRDVLVVALDTTVLAVTVYQNDTDATPLDVSGAAFVLNLYRDEPGTRGWWDYGFCGDRTRLIVAQVPGNIITATTGRVDFALAADPQDWIAGRFWYEMAIAYPSSTPGFEPADFAVTDFTGDFNTGSVPAPSSYLSDAYTILSGVLRFSGAIAQTASGNGASGGSDSGSSNVDFGNY